MKAARAREPEIFFGNRQRAVRVSVRKLQKLIAEVMPLCLGRAGEAAGVLGELEAVEISLVSDRVIARVHRQFMDIPGATDVITFAHGEIVVSATTAEREAIERGEATEREVFRYIVHGLLHLNGHEDTEPTQAAAMWRAQEELVQAVWPVQLGERDG